jgi:hypothetical protein
VDGNPKNLVDGRKRPLRFRRIAWFNKSTSSECQTPTITWFGRISTSTWSIAKFLSPGSLKNLFWNVKLALQRKTIIQERNLALNLNLRTWALPFYLRKYNLCIPSLRILARFIIPNV